MAKMTADEAKTILKTDVGLTDEQLAVYTPAQLAKLAEGYMRQSDYDRSMNEGKTELDATRAELSAANERLNAELAEWATIQASGKELTAKQQRALDQAQQRSLALEQRVRRMAGDLGLDPEKELADVPAITTPITPANQPNQPDLSGFVKASDLQTALGNLAHTTVTLPAELFALATEHQQLFSKPLDPRTITAELTKRANTRNNQQSLDPRQNLERPVQVGEAKAAAEEKRVADLVAAAEQRGREAAYSEARIPGQIQAPGSHSPLFKQADRKSALQRPQPGQTVNSAAAAFRTGKYRPQSGNKPAA